MRKGLFVLAVAGAMLLPAYAQDTQAGHRKPGRIQMRRENQQDRIAQGVASGQLPPGETAHLEHQESNLNRQIRNDRKANGGSLTAQEQRQINRKQNHLSRNIDRDKHTGRVQPR